jgi:hypothetical protein
MDMRLSFFVWDQPAPDWSFWEVEISYFRALGLGFPKPQEDDHMRNHDERGHELRLPFAGFYQSVHDYNLDTAAVAAGMAPDEVDWAIVRLGYAQAYTRRVATLTGLEMTFSRVNPPEFYNFGTDEILVRVAPDLISELHSGIMADPAQAASFRDRVREELSPRAGFAPYFPADLDDWGPLKGWDPAQISLLLDHAFARAGADEEEIADSTFDRAVELVANAPRAAAYSAPEAEEDPSP